VQVPLETSGKRKPRKNSLGLYRDFLIELYRWMFNFFVSAISSRTRSRRIDFKKPSETADLEDMKRRVAARMEFGVHLSGFVRGIIKASMAGGREGRSLKGLGSFPDL
jgi:hypothetical protein